MNAKLGGAAVMYVIHADRLFFQALAVALACLTTTDTPVPAADDVVRSLLERGVLYTSALAPATLNQGQFAPQYYTLPPGTISLWCDDPKCSREMEWDRERDQDSNWLFAGIHALVYACRHTPAQKATFIVLINAAPHDSMLVELIGRTPRFTPHVTPEVAKALSDHDTHWYSQALEARAGNMGVAALAYMRRVVENELNRILDFLIDQLSAEEGRPEHLDALAAARQLKGENSFEPKARAADTVLPTSFFPDNRNPFVTLHALCSEGVHSLDDVESAERFDEAKELFELLFEKLARQAEDRRVFADRLKKLKPRRKS